MMVIMPSARIGADKPMAGDAGEHDRCADEDARCAGCADVDVCSEDGDAEHAADRAHGEACDEGEGCTNQRFVWQCECC